jgi:hypothetical protein
MTERRETREWVPRYKAEWVCPFCGKRNYSSRTSCRRCTKPIPVDPGPYWIQPTAWEPTDKFTYTPATTETAAEWDQIPPMVSPVAVMPAADPITEQVTHTDIMDMKVAVQTAAAAGEHEIAAILQQKLDEKRHRYRTTNPEFIQFIANAELVASVREAKLQAQVRLSDTVEDQRKAEMSLRASASRLYESQAIATSPPSTVLWTLVKELKRGLVDKPKELSIACAILENLTGLGITITSTRRSKRHSRTARAPAVHSDTAMAEEGTGDLEVDQDILSVLEPFLQPMQSSRDGSSAQTISEKKDRRQSRSRSRGRHDAREPTPDPHGRSVPTVTDDMNMIKNEKEHSRKWEMLETAPLSSSSQATSTITKSAAQGMEMRHQDPAADASSTRAPIDLEPYPIAKPKDALVMEKPDDIGSLGLAVGEKATIPAKNNEDIVKGASSASSTAAMDLTRNDI